LVIPLFRPFSSIIEDRSVGQPQEVHIRKLQDFYWSDADPDGRGFVPLADALRKAGDFREAHRLLREGLGRHPDFLSGHVVAAWLSVDQGHTEEAESQFRTALELDPRNLSALRGLAEVLLDRGEVGSALGFLEALLHEDPMDLDLPNRVLDLRAQTEAPTGAGPDTDPEPARSVWDDPHAVADELNWDAAALQSDSSPDDSPDESEELVPPPSVVEDEEAIPSLEELDDALVTSTLGDIYLRQGLFGRAERVFETLLGEDPENEHLKHRLEEVRSLLQAQGAEPDEKEGREWRTPTEVEIVSIFSLAPDEVRGAPAEAGAPEEVAPIEALAPTEVVPIESLALDRVDPVLAVEAAPDEPITVDALAPDEPITVDALAPDEPITIDALAPDEPITVDALAPDGPVPIESLAPEFPPDQNPEGGADEDEPRRDPTIDAFENWLDNLR
jgi:tetratricopeptide (TPR) repeat protein